MDELVSSNSSFHSLPDDVFIVEILSRLDSSQSIVRLAMASKQFQSLCSYPSVLEFKEVPYDNFGFFAYIKKFFDARTKSKNTKHDHFRRFRMCLPAEMGLLILFKFVSVRLLRWFHKALSLNVQEVILSFHGQPASSDFFDERPELMMNPQEYSMMPLNHLRVLSLINIPIALNESFGDWISSYCVSLQTLKLSDVLVLPTRLKITSSSLRVFTIEGDFKELHVASAPKLEILSVTWNLIDPFRDELEPLVMISETPNLRGFLLENFDKSYDSLRYGSSSDDDDEDGARTKFPSLRSAIVLLPDERDSLISLSSLKGLLNDISQTRYLCVSDTILHKISKEGIIDYAKLFRNLSKFHVRIEGDKAYKWWEKADTIPSFAKNIPNLKIFKLTTSNYYYNLQAPLEWLQNALSLNIQELDLQFKENNNMNDSNYLNVPELRIHYDYPSNNLRVLTLKDIPIGLNQSFEDWVSNCCVNLYELDLSGVFVVPSELRITSSSLTIFAIDAHFTNLHIVSAPELVILHVTWNLVYRGTQETGVSLRVSDSPKLEDLLLKNNTLLPLEYYNNDDCKSSFPYLQFAAVLIPEIENNISLNSLKRLLLDVSQARKLRVSHTILRKISCSGTMDDSGNSLGTLENLHVHYVRVNKKSSLLEKTRQLLSQENKDHQIIMSFVQKIPSLMTFKVTMKSGSCDPLVSKSFRETLVDNNIVKFGISRAVTYLDDNKVKVEIVPGDDETLLLQHIIDNAPQDLIFIFSYLR